MHIIFNGEITRENRVDLNNRSFRYGDSLFETIRVIKNEPVLLKEHLQRLHKGISVLKMDSEKFSADKISGEIKELLLKNEIQNDARIRFTVFRNEGGYYTPFTNSVSYIIEAEKIEQSGYLFNTKGLTVDVYDEIKKPFNLLSELKSGNSLLYVLAGIYKNQKNLDDCILLNTQGHLCECISSNIFIIKNGSIYTPPITDGCVAGIMRAKIMVLASKNNIRVNEMSITPAQLLGADEVFLTNAISGIKWVMAYKDKRYFNTVCKMLAEKLNN